MSCSRSPQETRTSGARSRGGPTFRFNDLDGWFRNPCHGETYDMAGYRVFGPAPRGLDRLGVEIDGSLVTVDLADVRPGPERPPEGYEFQTGGASGPLNR